MSSLYPSLEDMQVHRMAQAQENVIMQQMQSISLPAYTQNPYAQLSGIPSAPVLDSQPSNQRELYPGLGDFMGLELSEHVIALNMPEYLNNSSSLVS